MSSRPFRGSREAHICREPVREELPQAAFRRICLSLRFSFLSPPAVWAATIRAITAPSVHAPAEHENTAAPIKRRTRGSDNWLFKPAGSLSLPSSINKHPFLSDLPVPVFLLQSMSFFHVYYPVMSFFPVYAPAPGHPQDMEKAASGRRKSSPRSGCPGFAAAHSCGRIIAAAVCLKMDFPYYMQEICRCQRKRQDLYSFVTAWGRYGVCALSQP